MNVLILDIYPSNNLRLVKDTAGGYGTGNEFIQGFAGKLLNKLIKSMISMPAMSSMYIFSILKNQGHNVEYIRTTINFNLQTLDKYEVIIIPSSIIACESEVYILKRISKIKNKIFITGIVANILKEKYKTQNSYIIPGEPEFFFLKFKLLEICEHHKYNTYDTIGNSPIKDIQLDELPFPAWDEYCKKYPLKNNFLSFNSKIAIPIIATRGCPYSCSEYCTYPLQQGKVVRFRSIDNIISEIKHWKNKLNAKKFVFRDPVFSINKNFTINLCKKIIEEQLNIEFLMETHLRNLDDELIHLLQKAGLRMVYVGIESSGTDILKNIKRFTIKKDIQFEIIDKLKKNGIITKSMFMLANPNDDANTTMDTINYSKYLPNELVQFSVFTPYPGTPIFEFYKNIITKEKLESFNQYNLVYKHKYFTDEILEKFKKKAYLNFYLRIKSFPIIIKSLKSLLF